MNKSIESPAILNPKATSAKPPKPYEGFPLFPHNSGRWAKKIRGAFHYFGSWRDDPDGKAALETWLNQRDDLMAGRKPRPKDEQRGGTVAVIANAFLTFKRERLMEGRIGERTFYEAYRACERVYEAFGKSRVVSDLGPDDFGQLRKRLTKTLGPVALGNEISRIRAIFKWAADEGKIDRVPRYGQSFSKPSAPDLRRVRAAKQVEHGKRMFSAAELRKIIDAAPQPLRAMILLACNGGFGQTDCSEVPQSALDLEGGWLEFPRPKTGVHRRIPLWPETIAALREAIAARPRHTRREDAGLCFLTKFGQRFVKIRTKIGLDDPENYKGGTPADALGQEFSKLLVSLKLKRPGLSFYGIRHGFETISSGSLDQVAVNSIMGHCDNSMAGCYREVIGDDRLRRVVDHVYNWLFPPEALATATGSEGGAP